MNKKQRFNFTRIHKKSNKSFKRRECKLTHDLTLIGFGELYLPVSLHMINKCPIQLHVLNTERTTIMHKYTKVQKWPMDGTM